MRSAEDMSANMASWTVFPTGLNGRVSPVDIDKAKHIIGNLQLLCAMKRGTNDPLTDLFVRRLAICEEEFHKYMQVFDGRKRRMRVPGLKPLDFEWPERNVLGELS